LIQGYKTVFTNKRVMISTLVQALVLGGLFSYIASSPQIFTNWLHAENKFPLYFCGIALFSALSNILMIYYLELIPNLLHLPVFIIWSSVLLFTMAMSVGNLMALAMEPVGHIAGLASSIIGSTSTFISIIIAMIIGMLFNGTGLPLITGVTILAILSFVLNLKNPRVIS